MPTLALFASRGPFGPTYAGCLLLPLLLLGPFALLAAVARSLLSAEPLPRWLLALAVLGAAGVGYVVWREGLDHKVSGFWLVWRWAGVGAAALVPAVLVREGRKRDWFGRAGQ
jgi:hypothetical protein